MEALEALLAQFPHTIAAVASLATLLATVVALFAAQQAQRQSRPALQVRITSHALATYNGRSVFFAKDPKTADVVSLVFKNRSPFPIQVGAHSLWIRFPIVRTAASLPPFPETFEAGPVLVEPFSDVPIFWAPADEFLGRVKATIRAAPPLSQLGWHFVVSAKGGARVSLKVHRDIYRALPWTLFAFGKYGRSDNRTLEELNPNLRSPPEQSPG